MQRKIQEKPGEVYVPAQSLRQSNSGWFADSITANDGFKNVIESSAISSMTAYFFNKWGVIELSVGDAAPMGFFTKMFSNQITAFCERNYPDFMKNHPYLQALIPVGAAITTNIPVWVAHAASGTSLSKVITDSAVVLAVPVMASVAERLSDKPWAIFFGNTQNPSNTRNLANQAIQESKSQIFNKGIANLRG